MPKFRGKKGECFIHPADLAWVVEPAPGGLWSFITLFPVGGTFQAEVEGTLEATARALLDARGLEGGRRAPMVHHIGGKEAAR